MKDLVAKSLKVLDPSLRSGRVSGGETSFVPETSYLELFKDFADETLNQVWKSILEAE